MSKKNTLDLSEIFFEALEYPYFARANFFLTKQNDTKWSRGVFLTALNEVYHECIVNLQRHFNAKKRTVDNLKIEDFKITIKDLVGIENDKLIDKKALDEVFYSLQYIPYFDRTVKNFSPFEIISFAETALLFIKQEFYEQSKKTISPFPRPRTRGYFTYLIAQDGPFFSFPKFKNAFRELLYTTNNSEKIEKLFIAFHKAAIEIVKLWNEEIYFIERKAHSEENDLKSERVRVEFHSDSLKHSWWSDEKMFDNSVPHEFYLNQDFASYAANIANLINSEIIHGKPTKLIEFKKDFLTDFIEGIQHLQIQNENEVSVNNILNKKLLEAPFRNYFSTWFTARNYSVNSESLRGNKHIDLKVEHPLLDKKIIEFKGWWNPKKDQLVFQLFNYLTQFEGDGYIFVINHTEKDINDLYHKLICIPETGYLNKSWKRIRFKRSSFYFYQSVHILNTNKVKVYHLLFDIYNPKRIH